MLSLETNFSLKSKSRFKMECEGKWSKKKNRFLCLIPQKNRLEKRRLKVKLVFENIDFCGSLGLKSTKK